MVDFLLHVHKRGGKPFQSLSALPEMQAIQIMNDLYIEGSIFWERFKEPIKYLTFRKQVEEKLRSEFVIKGGHPKSLYPIYFMLGKPKWTEIAKNDITIATTTEIVIPLSVFKAEEISFTYPDSMVSALIVAEKNPEYYDPTYHGKVFTLREIIKLAEQNGLPGEGWETKMPKHYANYIEAQVWNSEVLLDYSTTNR